MSVTHHTLWEKWRQETPRNLLPGLHDGTAQGTESDTYSSFTLLVPFNVLGLALPVTTALALAGPSYQAIQALDRNDEQGIKNILIYFVVFGLVQTVESLMGGFLERHLREQNDKQLFANGQLVTTLSSSLFLRI